MYNGRAHAFIVHTRSMDTLDVMCILGAVGGVATKLCDEATDASWMPPRGIALRDLQATIILCAVAMCFLNPAYLAIFAVIACSMLVGDAVNHAAGQAYALDTPFWYGIALLQAVFFPLAIVAFPSAREAMSSCWPVLALFTVFLVVMLPGENFMWPEEDGPKKTLSRVLVVGASVGFVIALRNGWFQEFAFLEPCAVITLAYFTTWIVVKKWHLFAGLQRFQKTT